MVQEYENSLYLKPFANPYGRDENLQKIGSPRDSVVHKIY